MRFFLSTVLVILLSPSNVFAQIAISEDGVTFPDNSVQTAAAQTTRYEIGDTGPGGGIVFYVTALGFHGLEAAPAEQDTTAQWCPSFTDIAGVENLTNAETEDPNSGSRNTPLIAAECGDASAAGVAAAYVWPNGQMDGFLPNKEELKLLHKNKDVVVGLASAADYWSSSEYDDSHAWSQRFIDGIQDGSNDDDFKSITNFRVRAVRVF